MSEGSGKAALVTGGGSGINLEFVRILLDKGYSVIVGDLQYRPEVEPLLTRFPHPPTAGKPSLIFQKTDVTSWVDLSALWTKAVGSFPSVDIVVPGAGLFEPQWASFWEPPRTATNPDSQSRDAADGAPGHYAIIDVNLTHPARLSQLAIGHWTRNKLKGSIVFIGSIAGYTSGINTPLYFATKHGLHGFVRSLGALRDSVGIRTGCVAPGAVRTPLLMEDPTKSGMRGQVDEMAEPREIAEVMYQLVVKEEFGNGTILECTKGGVTRVIPEFFMEPPAGSGASLAGYVEAGKKLVNDLRDNGLQV